MFLLTAFVIVLFLVALNALYVAAEFAAVNTRHSQIHRLAEQGNTLAAALLPWLEDSRKLDQYIATCQVGITISSLVLGAYGQRFLAGSLAPVLEQWCGLSVLTAGSVSALVILSLLTTLQVVLGELVPKSLALQFSVRTALLTFYPMLWSLNAFSWFIRVLNGSGEAILKLFRLSLSEHRHIHSSEEFETLITESRDGGFFEPNEHMRLYRALRLGKKSARQVMVPRTYMESCDVDTPPAKLLQQVLESPHSRLPVHEGSLDNIIGILITKEVLIGFIENGKVAPVRELLHPVILVPESLSAESVLTSMRRQRTYQAIVVDEFGGTEGLVSLEDVLKEMLGEVADEFTSDKPKPEKLSGGRIRLPGLMRLEEVESWIGIVWQGEADTVSGYVIESLGYFPSVGEQFVLNDVEVQVELVGHNAIQSLIVTQPVLRSEGEKK